MIATRISNQRFKLDEERLCGPCPFGPPEPPGRWLCLSLLFCSQCMFPGCLSMIFPCFLGLQHAASLKDNTSECVGLRTVTLLLYRIDAWNARKQNRVSILRGIHPFSPQG